MKYFHECPVIVMDGPVGRDQLWLQLSDAISLIEAELIRLDATEDRSPRRFRLQDAADGLAQLAKRMEPYRRDQEALFIARKRQFERVAERYAERVTS